MRVQSLYHYFVIAFFSMELLLQFWSAYFHCSKNSLTNPAVARDRLHALTCSDYLHGNIFQSCMATIIIWTVMLSFISAVWGPVCVVQQQKLEKKPPSSLRWRHFTVRSSEDHNLSLVVSPPPTAFLHLCFVVSVPSDWWHFLSTLFYFIFFFIQCCYSLAIITITTRCRLETKPEGKRTNVS